MEFGVLGPLEVVEGDHRYSLGGPKQRAVLAVMIAHAGLPVATGTLINSIYGDAAPERAHRSIHTFVSNLRAELGDVIEPASDGYVFVADRSAVDAVQFEDGLAEAEAIDDPETAGSILRKILGLWRGHAYANVDTYDSLSAEISRLEELRVTAISRRIDSDLATGRHASVAAELESLVVDYPMREDFWAQQMVALYRSGRQAEALRWFNKARTRLVEETGLDPSPELRDLERRILDHDPSLKYEPRPSIKKAAILVADVADLRALTNLAPAARDDLVERQDAVLADAVAEHGGEVFAHRGSAMYAVFDAVSDAAEAAADSQQQLAANGESMRIAVGFGDVEVRSGGRVIGPPVNRAAALAAAAHGGQVLLPADAQQALADGGGAGWVVRSLGSHSFESMPEPIPVHQLVVAGLPESFPPLRLRELPPPIPGAGEGLPGYELRDEVGSGLFGVVHRAYQPSVGREVAIKIIRSEFANHPEFIRRFEVEAQLVARLEHPHIVPLYDYWREPDGAFLVMRWLRGGSLAERLRGGVLPTGDLHSLLEDIVPALDHAHRHGVVHRDLKPSNILFDTDGNAFLTDFGVAKRVDQAGAASIADDVRGLAAMVARCLEGSSVSDETQRFLDEAGDGRFTTLTGFIEAWERATGQGNAASEELRFTPTRNPYKGLRAFGELDAADFYGRDAETEQLVAAVAAKRLVAVVGPSGIGKSSVVRAGLLPALRAGAVGGSSEWLITDLLPGAYPFKELASALFRVATEPSIDLEDELRRDRRGLVRAAKRHLPDGAMLLLVLDQFEELFTLVGDEDERAAFLELLHTAVTDGRSDIRVVLTMRADFFDEPLRFGEFGELLRDSTVPVAAPAETALRDIIAEPAAGVGVAFEPGLVERIAADVKDQPGALPLLEFSLTELFSGRETDELSIAAHEDSGGVLGALGRRAEEIYSRLNPVARDATRQIFLRLVNVSDSGGDTRKRVRVRELEQLEIGQEELKTVLDEFGDHRLLTFDRDPITRGPNVEVAHEAILTHWPRLAEWIADQREDLLLHSRLAVAVADWEAAGRSEDYLLSGGRLTQHVEWTSTTDLSLSAAETELLAESGTMEAKRRTARRKLRRRTMALLAAAAVVATVFGVVAAIQRSSARQAQLEATAGELALQATAQVQEDPELGVLLALEAVRTAQAAGIDLFESTNALRTALSSSRAVARYDGGFFAAAETAGSLIATGSPDNGVILRDLAGGRVVAELDRADGRAIGAAFTPDGDYVAVMYAAEENPVWLWDVNGTKTAELPGPDTSALTPPHDLSFHHSGRLLATSFLVQEEVVIWDVDTQQEEATFPFLWGGVEFVPGTDRVALGDQGAGEIRIFDLAADREVAVFPLATDLFRMGVSPDGQTVVTASANGRVVSAHDLESGQEKWTTPVARPGGIEWLPQGDAVAIGSEGGSVVLLDAGGGKVTLRLDGGHSGGVLSMAATPHGTLTTSGRQDLQTVVWNLGLGPGAEVGEFDTGTEQIQFASYAPFPTGVFASDLGPPSAAHLLSTTDGSLLHDVDNPLVGNDGLETLVPLGGGSLLIETSPDGQSLIRDTASLDVVYTAPDLMVVMTVSPDGALAIVHDYSGSELPLHRVVDLASEEVVATLDSDGIGFPQFSPDGSLVAVWNLDDTITEVFRSDDGKLFVTVPAMWLTLFPDGERAAVVDREGTLWIVDLQALLDGETLAEAAHWHSFSVRGQVIPPSQVVSDDGSLLALTSRVGEVTKIWDTESGVLVAEIDPGRSAIVPYIFFHPDEPHVTMVGDDGRLLTYTLDVDELVAIAEERVTRSLDDAECQAFLHVDVCPDPR